MGAVSTIIKKSPKIFKKVTPPPAPKPVAPPVVTPVVAPTVAEVSQSEAANATNYNLRKRKGKSATIITGPAGIQQDEDLVLGAPSLLGS